MSIHKNFMKSKISKKTLAKVFQVFQLQYNFNSLQTVAHSAKLVCMYLKDAW